jgi:hypothetical protein
MNNFIFYVCDTETTNLDSSVGDIIELSLFRLSDNTQRTWCLKPLNFSGIDPKALKVNGHKLDDITHRTKEGQERYFEPSKAVADIENWMMDDGASCEERVLVAQNAPFDKGYIEKLWSKVGASNSFPFGRKYIDTLQIEIFLDFCKGEQQEYYNLGNIIKKYGVKLDKAHTAAADTLATKDLFLKQAEFVKNFLNK